MNVKNGADCAASVAAVFRTLKFEIERVKTRERQLKRERKRKRKRARARWRTFVVIHQLRVVCALLLFFSCFVN